MWANFPGVTVERVQGPLRLSKGADVLVDLPGTYSLTAFSREEAVCGEFLREKPPDAIVNVVDATCPARGLYLTLQLLETGLPVVVAMNLMDEVRAAGGAWTAARFPGRWTCRCCPCAPPGTKGWKRWPARRWPRRGKGARPACRIWARRRARRAFWRATHASTGFALGPLRRGRAPPSAHRRGRRGFDPPHLGVSHFSGRHGARVFSDVRAAGRPC